MADHDPMSLDELAHYASDGRGWVAIADDDGDDAGGAGGDVVGYVVVDVVDGNAHIEQISVRPDHQGRGISRALIDAVEAWAADRRMPALSLTTFGDVPWNRPLYEHLGFRVLADNEIGPELRQVREEEAELGLDPSTRVCMIRAVSGIQVDSELPMDP